MDLRDDQWFTDYLTSAGYWVENQPTLFKQMAVSAFPPLNDKLDEEVTKENSQRTFEPRIVRFLKTLRMHIKMEEEFDMNHTRGTHAATSAFLANRH